MTKAVILSAGMGTRLGELTRDRPKVMVEIAGRPMLEHHVLWMREAGITDFFINLFYLGPVIESYFGDGARWGVKIHYSHEEKLLGTAGSLYGFQEQLTDTFLVQYGDVYSRLDLKRFQEFHQGRNSAATLVVHPSSHPHDSDIVTLAEDGRIERLYHKPGDDRFGNIGNAGAYLLEPVAMDYLTEERREQDFCKHVFPKMLAAEERVFGYNTDDLLLDVGTPERLAWIEQYLSDL